MTGRMREDLQSLLEGVGREGCHLSLAFRPIGTIPEALAIEEGPHVTDLNLTECDLRSFANLQHFPQLTTLVLDKNQLEDLEGCPPIPTLKTLWFNNNKVTDLSKFMDQVLQRFPALRDVSMMRNPACPGLMDIQRPDLAACRLYRLYVVFRAPQLETVDATAVTDEERTNAKARGNYAEKRRPSVDYQPPGMSGGSSGSLSSKKSSSSWSLFDSGPTTTYDPVGVKPALEPAQYRPTRQSVALLTVSSRRYDGRHSEGNRFILDDQL